MRKYQSIEIKPDHWEADAGILGLAFGPDGGNTTTIVRCTEEDLEALYQLLAARRQETYEKHEHFHDWQKHNGFPLHTHNLVGKPVK